MPWSDGHSFIQDEEVEKVLDAYLPVSAGFGQVEDLITLRRKKEVAGLDVSILSVITLMEKS